MSEINTPIELSAYSRFMEEEPKPVILFVPAEADKVKEAFLHNEVGEPHHSYPRLDEINFEEKVERLQQKGAALLVNEADSLSPARQHAYREVVERYTKMTYFLEAAKNFRTAETSEARSQAKERYMALNKELYGEPDKEVYEGLLAKKVQVVREKNLTGKAAQLRDELKGLIDIDGMAPPPTSLEPSGGTVEWMHDMVLHMYGPWLRYVPEDKESFNREEVKSIFQAILDQEFAGAADDWRVVIREAGSINVRTPDKEIIIPVNKPDIKRAVLEELICHEIGVHVLRSIIGEDTDSEPLRYGTSDYYDTDEGLGVAVQDALRGQYRPHGEDYYVIAGLAYFEGKSFREIFEIWWRLRALNTLKTDDISPETLEKSRSFSYGQIMRIMRGTDELPWFKDLAYYNGPRGVWEYVEEHKGDELQFMFLLSGGKINMTSAEDRRLVLEAKSSNEEGEEKE